MVDHAQASPSGTAGTKPAPADAGKTPAPDSRPDGAKAAEGTKDGFGPAGALPPEVPIGKGSSPAG